MKKILFLMMIFNLFGCVNHTTKPSSNADTIINPKIRDLTYFKEQIEESIPNLIEKEIDFKTYGAIDGITFYDSYQDNRLMLLQYDESSNQYQIAQQSQTICDQEERCKQAAVDRGFALVLDELFPDREVVIDLFDQLQ